MRPATKNEMKALRLYATDVAGARAKLVMRALDGRVYYHLWDEQRSALYFDETTFRIERLELAAHACPFTQVHEFGHAYHAFHWPILTALMRPPDPRAEAVAFLFEYELHAHAERYQRAALLELWAKEREPGIAAIRKENGEAFDILKRAVQTHRPTQDFHTLVERIVNGA